MENLKWLENWYLSNCNGDWEHCYGIKVETLDNPGWYIEINLHETADEGKHFEILEHEKANDNWIHCKVENNIFYGYGGINNLVDLLQVFKDWSSSNNVDKTEVEKNK
jgi:hypothetical protein